MAKIVGIDPDSEAHGVAVYVDGKLEFLGNVSLMGIITDPYFMDGHFAIEEVCKQTHLYKKHKTKNARADQGITRRVGMNQQAMQELVRALEWHGVTYELHHPSSAWKKNTAMFEKITGWKKRSNQDNRSAAYFGFLAIRDNK